MKAQCYGASHVGKVRTENQDRFLIKGSEDGAILAVADGLGGQAGGARAAAMAVSTLKTLLPGSPRPDLLLERIGDHIRLQGEEDPELGDMGTTLTLAEIDGDRLTLAHVGDSRCYLFRGGALRQLTRDHRFVTELVEHGDLSPEQARRHPMRNLLDQCLGCPDCRPDVTSHDLEPGDRVLLCSDGLSEMVEDRDMAAILGRGESPEKTVEALIRKALEAGGRDNVTVIVADLGN